LITLDPEFVGNLAPPSKMTTTTFDGKPEVAVPYARLSRLERLRVSGKIDETEEHSGDDGDEAEGDAKKATKEEREKRKMRGKGKSLKRYLRKQRKNVVDPAAVGCCLFRVMMFCLSVLWILDCDSDEAGEAEGGEEKGGCCGCCVENGRTAKTVGVGSVQAFEVDWSFLCNAYDIDLAYSCGHFKMSSRELAANV
jgi:hypothetical protein